jgi:hypothetical protein
MLESSASLRSICCNEEDETMQQSESRSTFRDPCCETVSFERGYGGKWDQKMSVQVGTHDGCNMGTQVARP